MKKFLILLLCISFFLGNPAEAAICEADSNDVKGEIYLPIAAAAQKENVAKAKSQSQGKPVANLKNEDASKIDRPDPKSEKAKSSKSEQFSAEDIDLLARLVHAEAKGESYRGKIAVAATVINRVEDPLYPETIPEVVYEYNNGYQYCPVGNGEINSPADKDSYKAVAEALQGNDPTGGALSFFNPAKSSNSWIRNRIYRITIGNHVFVQ